MLEPREEKSITVHFIANRTVGISVIEKSITVHFIAVYVLCWDPGLSRS